MSRSASFCPEGARRRRSQPSEAPRLPLDPEAEPHVASRVASLHLALEVSVIRRIRKPCMSCTGGSVHMTCTGIRTYRYVAPNHVCIIGGAMERWGRPSA